MKKYIAGILGIAGVAVLAAGGYMKYKKVNTISIIGGSDGPTSIFIAGTLGNDISWGLIGVGAVLAGIVVTILIRRKK